MDVGEDDLRCGDMAGSPRRWGGYVCMYGYECVCVCGRGELCGKRRNDVYGSTECDCADHQSTGAVRYDDKTLGDCSRFAVLFSYFWIENFPRIFVFFLLSFSSQKIKIYYAFESRARSFVVTCFSGPRRSNFLIRSSVN